MELLTVTTNLRQENMAFVVLSSCCSSNSGKEELLYAQHGLVSPGVYRLPTDLE